MPAYYDENTKTWYCKFYYTDYTGTKKQKKKRGFKLQREAKEYERSFILQQSKDINMPFKDFVELYFEDMGHRLKQSTIQTKRNIVDTKILPFFGNVPLSQILPADIRKWQNKIIAYENDNNSYSDTYLRTVNAQLKAILNYAEKYYNLKENPSRKVEIIGKGKANEMQFWTKQEFDTFISGVSNKQVYTIFSTLYYTGMRIGELLALTKQDIDLNNQTITINKSVQRIKKQDVITEPKTPKSNRIIAIPHFLCNILLDYMTSIYDLQDQQRLFLIDKQTVRYHLIRECKKNNVKQIRLHDFRHSHASLLIELGFSPLLIAERLGHEKVETTLNIYSHLYPNKQEEVAEKLQSLIVPN